MVRDHATPATEVIFNWKINRFLWVPFFGNPRKVHVTLDDPDISWEHHMSILCHICCPFQSFADAWFDYGLASGVD